MTPTNPPTVPPDRPAARPRIVIPRDLADELTAIDPASGIDTAEQVPATGQTGRSPVRQKGRKWTKRSGRWVASTDERASMPVAVDPLGDRRGYRAPGSGTGWRSGISAGLQASVLALAVTVAPAIAAYVSTAGASANADTAWTAALTVGVAVWLQGFGGVATVSGVAYSVIPLGLSIVMVALSRLCARRSLAPTFIAWTVMVGTSGLATALVGLAFGGPARAGVPRAVIGAMVLTGAGAAWGVRTVRRRADVVPPWATGPLAAAGIRIQNGFQRVPRPVRLGAAAAWVAVLTVIGTAAAVVCWWIIAGRDSITTVFDSLAPDAIGAVVLMLSQLALLPLLVVWAVGWLAGPGFCVGAGTLWSTSTVTTAPLPALPLLGALPERAVDLPMWVLVVGAGVLGGWWAMRHAARSHADLVDADADDPDALRRRDSHGRVMTPWWHGAITMAVMALVCGALLAGLSVLGVGAAGPGRLATMGADPIMVGLVTALEVFGGGLVALVLTRPATGDFLRRRRAGR